MIIDVNLVKYNEQKPYRIEPIKPDMDAGYNNPYKRHKPKLNRNEVDVYA